VREDGGADLAGSIHGEDVVREDDGVDRLEGLCRRATCGS
jgi:hypothetical protein